MGRQLNKLSAAKLKSLDQGHHSDGGGLYLKVSGASRSWVFRFAANGTERWMGLGPIETISLAEAREAALQCRKQRLAGVDPIEHRNATRAEARVAAAKIMTFDQCVQAYLAAHRSKWRSLDHSRQWTNSIRDYASPLIGKLPISAIDTALVMRVLEKDVDGQPFWQARPETASRVRSRIENILSWATVRGYRTGDNPARWKGYLEKLLPAPKEIQKVVHHAALPYREIAPFLARVRACEGVVPRALEFLVLTAARREEVVGARWTEIDPGERVWTVPADRMKGGLEHRVPLSGRTLEILTEMASVRLNEFVFPGQRGRMAPDNIRMFIGRDLGRRDLTVHGFRSTFRDWAGEQTNFAREVCEAALAHKVGDAVEAAYRRRDALEKRRHLMEAWSRYCASPVGAAEVTPIRRGG